MIKNECMKKQILTLFCFAISLTAMQAQMEEKEETTSKYRKLAIGVSGGTGFGADLSYKFNDNLSVTARYNVLDYKAEDIEQEIDGNDVLIDANVDFKTMDLIFHYYPFKTAFNLAAGVGYFSNKELTINLSFAESIFIGDVEFTPENDIGQLIIQSEWKEIAPYVGIGFGRAVPNKRLGFGFEAGTYLAGSPKVTLDATGLIEGTKDQEPLVQESFSEFKFIPYITFRLSYSL